MRTASPLRYPGGKSALAGLIKETRRINDLGDRSIVEPFAGGAGASLSLLYLEETHRIGINDADPAIHDFWWSILNRSEQFLGLLASKRVSLAEWKRQRDIYRRGSRESRIKRGFAAFYLNRCNRSGIIMNGGPIGGIEQRGKWKLNARYNKDDLRDRCAKVAEYRDRITLSCKDGLELISSVDRSKTFLLIDPPYFEKGPTLYLNALDSEYHAKLAEQLKKMTDVPWILTYDDCSEIRRMYRGWATIRPFALRYVASERRMGKEVLVAPKWMQLPKRQSSLALNW